MRSSLLIAAGLSAVVFVSGCGSSKPSSSTSTTTVATTTTTAPTTTAPTTTAPTTTAPTTAAPTTAAPTTAAPTTAAPTTVAAPTTIATTTTAPNRPGYAKALGLWKEGSTVISADQSGYWFNAGAALDAGERTDTNTAGYGTAANELFQLSSLPETSETQVQINESHADVAALNAFFDTPGLYS